MEYTNKYYAVVRGRNAGIYTAWDGPDGAKDQVIKFKGSRYKSFTTLEEAQVWLKDNQNKVSEDIALDPNERLRELTEHRLKRHRVGDTALIYVNHFAQYGKYGWGININHPENPGRYSGAFKKTTASRLSLYAFLRGLENAQGYSNVVIILEDEYIVNALRKGWPMTWRGNSWNTWKGRPPINVDLWKQILPLFEQIEPLLELIPVHAGVILSKDAKQLAKKACKSKNINVDHGLQPYKGKFNKKNKRKRSKHVLNSKPTYSFSI